VAGPCSGTCHPIFLSLGAGGPCWSRGRRQGPSMRHCPRRREEGARSRVLVVPVTHAPPADRSSAIEIPLATKERLKLDGERSWIILTEYNVFRWPGPDLRLLPGDGPGSVAYGHLPPKLLRAMLDGFARQVRLGRALRTPRTERQAWGRCRPVLDSAAWRSEDRFRVELQAGD
jgi:hypothetical protein